jgi:hypothetical protein
VTRTAQALFAVVALAALAGLLVNQRLKTEPTYVHRVKVDESITPNGDGRRDVGTVQIVLGEPDDVGMAVLDAGGAVVRDLGTKRDLPARERILFRWDGRTDAGAVGPEGRYRFRVSLARRGQDIVLQRAMRVRRVPPRPAAGAPAAGSRPRSPRAARAPVPRSRASTSAVGPAVEKVALVVLAALAGAVLVLRRGRPRAAAMAAALGAAPALVVAHLWNGEPLAPLREHAVAAGAGALALWPPWGRAPRGSCAARRRAPRGSCAARRRGRWRPSPSCRSASPSPWAGAR